MSPIDVAEWLKQNLWKVKVEHATQMTFVHDTIKGEIVLPFTAEDLPASTLEAILRKAGIKK